MDAITFFVPGTPRPGGSKRAFRTKTGQIVVTEAGKYTKTWRQDVRLAAGQAFQGSPLEVPLYVAVVFLMPRPKSHYRTGRHAGELKPNAPLWHTSKPDRTKLLRSTEDALTGLVWVDDTQVVTGPVEKRYPVEGEQPGASVAIYSADHFQVIQSPRGLTRDTGKGAMP